MGSDEGGSGGGGSGGGGGHRSTSPYRKYSPVRNGNSPTRSIDSSAWRSYDNESSGDNQTAGGGGRPIPKFEVDPSIPLPAMVPIGTGSESESDGQGEQ